MTKTQGKLALMIALTASVFPSCTDMACDEKAEKERTDNPVKARIITEMPFRRWDEWVDGKRNHIFIMPAEGGATTDITPGDADSPIWTEGGSEEVAFSPDSRAICFSRFVENEAVTGNSDLFVMPVSGGTPKAIAIFDPREMILIGHRSLDSDSLSCSQLAV